MASPRASMCPKAPRRGSSANPAISRSLSPGRSVTAKRSILSTVRGKRNRSRAIWQRRNQDPPQDQAYPRPETGTGNVGRLLVIRALSPWAKAAGQGFPSPQARYRQAAGRDAPRRDLQFPLPAPATAPACADACSESITCPAMPTTSWMARRFCLDKGYHPCAALPGYEMYYFTILGGLSASARWCSIFQPTHADQVETIPGIKDMIAKFK